MSLKIFFLVAIFFKTCHSYRILAIYPTPSISHQIVFRPVIKELAARGHEITLLTPNPFETDLHSNITIIDLNFLYDDWKKIDFVKVAELNPFEMLDVLLKAMRNMMSDVLEMEEVQPIIQKQYKFDAVICEFLGYTPMYAFAKLYNVPLIGMTSLDMSPSEHASLGNVVHPVIHPHLVFPFYGDLTFTERLTAVYMTWFLTYFYIPQCAGELDKIIDKHFGVGFSNSYSLSQSASLAIINAHPALGYTRPIVPATIQVGLLHVQPPKPLPTDLKRYMDESARGVIYFSLGSNVKSTNLKREHFNTFIKVFNRLNYNILWKWENETMPDKPDNVRIQKWLPQQDILAHKNLKLFITHGGQQSMEEAVDRVVPLIVIPFFGDQEANSLRMEKLGLGRRLTLNELSPEKFEYMIHEVIENPSYKATIKELRTVVKDSPQSPIDTATWWIEYAIRHNGTKHTKYHGLGVPFWQYYLLDVIAVTVLFNITILYIIYFTFKQIQKCFMVKRQSVKIKIN